MPQTSSRLRQVPGEGAPPPAALVVLAAGASSRMGAPKALCRIGGQPFLSRVLAAGATSGLAPLVVVLGRDAGAIRPAIDLSGCLVLENPDPAGGPLSSLRIALQALATHAPALEALLVCPVDQPLVTAELLRELRSAFARTGAPIVVPTHGGRRGHPTLFAARLFSELLAAPLDQGARAVVRAHETEIVHVAADERVLLDIDTPEALAAAEVVEKVRAAQVVRVHEGSADSQVEDALAVEEPLELRLRGRALAVLMRTPGDDEELVRGFLLTEGIAACARDIHGVRHVAPNVIDAELPAGAERTRPQARSFFATSSCGVCGKASLAALAIHFPKVASDVRVSRSVLHDLPERLAAAQAVFARTGGLHAAGLFDAAGTLLGAREDVGRHNAVDKLVGWAAAGPGLPLSRHVLMVSGRTSFEVLQKAVAAGIPVVAAVSAPSSLAVRLAEEHGVTLVGFLRGRSLNVYAHAERIAG